MIAPWPAPKPEHEDAAAETAMATVMEVVRSIRNIRAEMNVPLGKRADVVIQYTDDGMRALLDGSSQYLTGLASVASLEIAAASGAKPPHSASAILPGLEVYLPLRGLIDLDREAARLRKALADAEAELARSRERLANPNFVARAPADVVAKEREKEATFADSLARLQQRQRIFEQV